MGSSAIFGVIAMVAIEYALNGGSLTGQPPPDPTFHVRLERGPCLGACPAYSVDIDAAGHVTFVGRKSTIEPSVPCQGVRHGRISAHGVAALEAAVDRANLFGLKDSYRAQITDQAAYVVTVTRRGKTKTVSDHVGQMVGMPKQVTDLENAIDVAADTRPCVIPPARPI